MPRRVIQFSTGNVGRHALRTIIERPDLELIGVHANGAAKVGRDAARRVDPRRHVVIATPWHP